MTQEQREEELTAMLQELTSDLAGEKMKAEMPSTPDRARKNPRPLARSVTNIHTEPNVRESNPTSELQCPKRGIKSSRHCTPRENRSSRRRCRRAAP